MLVGILTIRSTEQCVEFLGETVGSYGLTRSGFSATTTISRKAFGVRHDANEIDRRWYGHTELS